MSRRVLLVCVALAALVACTGAGAGGGFCRDRADCGGGLCVNGTCRTDPDQVVTLTVSDFAPRGGQAGTVVTIQGNGFGSDRGAVQVTFGGVAAEVVSVSARQIKVVAPELGAGDVDLMVTVDETAAEEELTFTYFYPVPVVSSIGPNHGPPGTNVTIYGSWFGPDPRQAEVTFGGVAAPLLEVGNGQLLVAAPEHAAGTVAIKVVAGGGTAVSRPEFTYETPTTSAPQVSHLSITQGWPGEPVTIHGSNFGATPGENVVRFVGRYEAPAGQVTAASATQLTVIAPPGGRGDVQVAVTVGGVTAASKPTFGYRREFELTPLAPLPVPALQGAADYVGFALGGQGYVVSSAGVHYRYDPGSDTWSRMASLEPSHPGAWGFTAGGLGYVGFGNAGLGNLAGIAAYDPARDAWTPLQPTGSIAISGVYQPYGTLIVAGNRVIVGNGVSGRMFTGTIGDGTIAWTQTLSYPDPAASSPLILSNGTQIYWGGGYEGDACCTHSTSFYRLDLAGAGSWTQIAPLPSAMYRPERDDAFVIGDHGFVMNDMKAWIFSFEKETWRWAAFDERCGYGLSSTQALFTIGSVAYVLSPEGSFCALRVEGPNPYAD